MLSASAYSFRQKSRLAISLSWIAGYTNVIAFLMCGGVVVAHVTGNVTHFGKAAGQIVSHPGNAHVAAWREIFYFGYVVVKADDAASLRSVTPAADPQTRRTEQRARKKIARAKAEQPKADKPSKPKRKQSRP